MSLVIAVVWTHQLAAVVSCVALMAHTLPIHTSAVVIALVGAGGHRTIWAFPSRVTEAAAGVVLVGTMATTACVHSLREDVKKELLYC